MDRIGSRLRALGLVAAAALVASCNVSLTTAHITDFTIAKDKEAKQAASAFAPHDPVYAKVTVGNVPDKVTLKWRLSAEKVAGFAEHAPLPEADTTFELAGSGNSTYTLKPPVAGWPAGTYGIAVSMLDASGNEKDMRNGTFAVGGDAGGAQSSAPPNGGAPEFSPLEFAQTRDGEAAETFATDTAKIFARTDFSGVPKGATLTATWVAEKARAVPAGTKLVSSDVVVDGSQNAVDFTITRPEKGWPPGTYRVDISVDGKVAASGRFEIGN